MENSMHIRRASHRLRLIFTAILVLIPTVNVLIWLLINELPDATQRTMLPYYVQLPLPVQARVLGCLVSFVPAVVVMYGIIVLIRLFRLYEAGHIFRAANVRCFRGISHVLMAWCGASIIQGPLMSIALTLHLPKGHRLLHVGLHSIDVTALLTGLVLAIMAWVMEEGRKLQEEQDYVI